MEDDAGYNDVATLLSNLCKDYSDEELVKIAELAARMKQDGEFRKNYNKRLKIKYIRELPKIQKGIYDRVSFSALNKEILSSIKARPMITRTGNIR